MALYYDLPVFKEVYQLTFGLVQYYLKQKIKTMENKKFLLLLGFSLPALVYAQESSHSVIAPAGTSEKGSTITLDWTMGELAVQSSETSNILLTEGFHQPMLIVEEVLEAPETPLSNQLNVWVGPNPTSANLYIKIDSELGGEAVLSLKTIKGRLLRSETVNLLMGDYEWNLGQYPSGLYLVTLHTKEGELLKSYKVIKK